MTTGVHIPARILLSEDELPTHWYNIRADMKTKHPPILIPDTKQPATLEQLSSIFCTELARQELDQTTRLIKIPDGLLDFYKSTRPSPLIRAKYLEKYLDTPCEIYYKHEGNNTSGSHKLNSAAAQVYYAKQEGFTNLTTETGAGQWGTALAMACGFYQVNLTVYMVKISSIQKPYRRAIIEAFGANLIQSPSNTTEVGRKILAADPTTGGSLGCAISEAIETSVKTPKCRYVLGSVLDHVLLHQSIIGQECKIALDKYGIKPDVVIGCTGGGSNLGGLMAPFMADRLNGLSNTQFIAMEPASCPSLTRGVYAYDFADTGKTTPLVKMYTVGSSFIPSPNHAGGLRFHGMSPIVSQLFHDKYIEARSVGQLEVFEAASIFSRVEGILPAPESSHAIRGAIDVALECKKTGEKKVILFGLSGTGYFDMEAYMAYKAGTMTDVVPTDEQLRAAFAELPKVE